MENEQVSSTNQTAVKSISIFVYNTHLFGGIFFAELGIEYHKDEKRRKEIVRRINASDYDVIGLCEVWADGYKEYIRKHCFERYPHYCYKSKGMIDLMGSGLMFLSRFPIKEWSFEAYKHLNGIDAVTYKGVLAMVINCDGEEREIPYPKRDAKNEEEARPVREKSPRVNEEGRKRKLLKGNSEHEKGDRETEQRPTRVPHLLRLFLTHCQAQNDAESSKSREKNWRQMREVTENFHPDVMSGTVLMGDMNTCYTEEADVEYVTMKSIFDGYATGLPEREMKLKDARQNTEEVTKQKEPIRDLSSNNTNNHSDVALSIQNLGSSGDAAFVPTIDPKNNTLARIFESQKIQIADFILYKDLTPVRTSQVVTDWKLEDGDDCSDHYPVVSTFSFPSDGSGVEFFAFLL